jgi:AcrR family transcriptional regulator
MSLKPALPPVATAAQPAAAGARLIKKRRPHTRQLILDEAARLFKERGFGNSSMRDLGARVGLDAASMYNHIKSKDEILASICFEVADAYLAQLTEAEALDAPYLEKIKALIRLHVRLMARRGAAVSVANSDWRSLTEPRLTEFKQARQHYEKGFASLLERGIAAGELQPLNVSVALFTILSAVRWVEWYKPARGLAADELETSIITMLLDGLAKK